MDRDKLKSARARVRVRIEADAGDCHVGYSAFALAHSLIRQGFTVETKLVERPRPTLRPVA
jgi:hypothetical protein